MCLLDLLHHSLLPWPTLFWTHLLHSIIRLLCHDQDLGLLPLTVISLLLLVLIRLFQQALGRSLLFQSFVHRHDRQQKSSFPLSSTLVNQLVVFLTAVMNRGTCFLVNELLESS